MFGKYKKVFLLGVASIVIALSFSLVSQTHTASAAEKDGTCSDADKQKGGVDGTKDVNGDQKAICTIPDGAGTGTGDKEDATTSSTCAVERIGWLLCPIIQGAGKMADKAFQFLSNNFLETEPELVSSTPDKGTQYAWNIARNLANIMFIVAFLIIIYSQVTGAGINNYGIKKMLPRLIIAAIAVNASYYICQIIVDLTNIMGREIQSFMVDTARGITTNAAMPMGGSFIFGKDSPGTLETIISGVLGLSIVWIFLPFLLLGSGTILITCIILIVILLMRKAFVVLLIVAAPVAFVAYLLPNTEKYFQKWLSMFWKLLLVFPIVGMLMGGGQLASAIILATGSHSTATYSDTGEKCVQLATHTTAGSSITSCNGGSVPFLLGLTAAVIAVAPLLAVGAVLKGALSAAGAIGGKIAGAVETYTKKGGEWGTKNTAIGRGMAARQAIKQNYKDQKFAKKMSGSESRGRYTRFASRGITGNAGAAAGWASGKIGQSNPKLAKGINAVTGGFQAQDSKLAANFAGAASKIEKDEITAAHLVVDKLETADAINQAQQSINSGNFDSPHLAALLEHLAKVDQKNFMMLASQVTKSPVKGGSVVSRSIAGSMSETGLYGGGDTAAVANGHTALDLASTASANLAKSGISANTLAGLSNDQINNLTSLAPNGTAASANIAASYSTMSKDQKGNMNNEKQAKLGGFY